MSKPITHTECVEIAYRWVLKNGGVGVAFKELKSLANEIPDVIGFDSWQSILIECKVSRSDFLSDKKKPHRVKGMGTWRFYCCPKGMIKVEELPAKWGLIYIDDKGRAKVEHDCRTKRIPCEHLKEGWRMTRAVENLFDVDVEEERRVMYTALRRLFIKGFVKHIYDKQYKIGAKPKDLILLNQTTDL